MRGALARQGIQESELKPGDALLFNFGWWRLWPDPARSNAQGPGVGREVAAWIVERKASMVGSDATTDVAMAVHEEVTLKHGIFNLEWMRFGDLLSDRAYEFLFVFTPLRLKARPGRQDVRSRFGDTAARAAERPQRMSTRVAALGANSSPIVHEWRS